MQGRMNSELFSQHRVLKWWWLFMVFVFWLSGCAATHFGVPEETWNRMSEPERLEAMRGFNERERLREESAQREAEARRSAEREQRLAQERRVRSIYEGHGRPGDLIRVSLQGGEMRFAGKHRPYGALAFSMASGETRELEVLSATHKYMTYRATLSVRYEDGLLLIDTEEGETRASRLTFEPAWRQGKRYVLDTRGAMDLRGVEVLVMTTPLPYRHH
jgi:hypothetical protein